MKAAVILVFAAAWAWVGPVHVRAQTVEEGRLLLEAATLESKGDYDGAERVVRRLLEGAPTSTGGIFALERILRAKGDTRPLLSAADTFLAHDPAADAVRELKIGILVGLDSLDAVRGEGERWLMAEPASERAYREVARAFGSVFGPERALEVLRRGRQVLGRADALALEIGYALLENGSVEEGREALLEAVPALKPEEATGVIQLASLLGRLSERGAAAMARAGARAYRGGSAEAARALLVSVDSLPEGERAPVLAEAARMADAARDADYGAGLRRRLLRDHPDAGEVDEATLALARHVAATAGGRDEAVRLLEELVARRPNAPLAPVAREEIERLRRGP